MQFINPVEILELDTSEISAVDNSLIKKAKRKLFAEIELSDNGHLQYKGLSLTKTDCEKAIDELESPSALEYYSHLAKNNLLNDFLVNGNDKLFTSFIQESIYKLPEFIKFISPFYAPKFDKAILKAFVDEDSEKLRSILRTQTLISTTDLNDAFKSLSIEILYRIQQIDSLTKDIKNEESKYSDDDIDEVFDLIVDLFPTEILNQLPAFFQSQINKIAAAINFLQLAIWNEFNTTAVSLHLLEHLLELNIETVSKPTFQKNYNIVKRKHKERIEQEKNAPTLKKWAYILITIQDLIKSVENKNVQASESLNKIKQIVTLTELNALPSYANEIRTQIVYSIRSLSVSCWNSYKDLKSAMALNTIASTISVDDDVKSKLLQDLNDFRELESKYKDSLVCFFCSKNTPDSSASFKTKLYKENKRTYFPKRSVEFSYVEVTIPRCSDCKSLHTAKDSLLSTQNLVAVILGGLGALIFNDSPIVGGIVGLVIGWIIGDLFDHNNLNKSKVKSTAFSKLSEYTLVKERLQDGWSLSRPIA